MMLVMGFWTFLRAVFFGSAAIALENVALRHQLLVLQRSGGRPRLARWDRILWVWLSRVWASWRASLVIVQPATVLAWHRQRLPALLAVDVQLIRITGPTLSSLWADSGDPFTHFDFWTLHDLPHQFTVEPNEADHLLWAGRRRLDEAAAWIHLGPAPPRHRGQRVFVNYAVWESTGHFKRAFRNLEFQSKLGDSPPSTVASPHLFRKVAVPDICVA